MLYAVADVSVALNLFCEVSSGVCSKFEQAMSSMLCILVTYL